MSKHVLSLEIPDTMNKCIFRVVDTSVYATGIPITCPLLQITVQDLSSSKLLLLKLNQALMQI